MTPEAMAATHARAFAGHGRAWSTAEFRDLLHSDHVFSLGDARAFALGRVVADEAELLTLATDPVHRRMGLARGRLRAFEAEAALRDATTAFLEVAEDNAAARALYVASGYAETGRRKGYYTSKPGGTVDALLLRKPLTCRPGQPTAASIRSQSAGDPARPSRNQCREYGNTRDQI